MKLYQRLINIWRLGDLEWMSDKQKLDSGLPIISKEPPRMAQIIHKETATEKFLKQSKHE